MMSHKAGFVSIIGKPNAGKSTLINALVGETLSVVNPRAQTTRHRILGILNSEDYQLVFSDTPGIMEPAYKLQQRMMKAVNQSLEDADIILLVDDLTNPLLQSELSLPGTAQEIPLVVALNKGDLVSSDLADQRRQAVTGLFRPTEIIVCSASTGVGVPELLQALLMRTPDHPPYYPKEDLTNRSVRFFVTEIIRGKLLDHYRQEVPYASEVTIESFTEEPSITRIRAVIFVERESQKVIMIGKKGEMMKKVGTEARLEIEKLVGMKVYLELHVKVKEKWRQKDEMLDYFGY